MVLAEFALLAYALARVSFMRFSNGPSRTILQAIAVASALCAFSVRALAEQLPLRTYTIADGLARDHITCIVQDSHGFVWFCTTEGLSRFDGYQFVNYGIKEGLPNRVVNDLLESRDGSYWLATEGGLVHFTPNTSGASAERSSRFRFLPFGNDLSAEKLVQDGNGTLWCGTSEGLYRVDNANAEWRASYVQLGMPKDDSASQEVRSLLLAREGSLFIGSPSGFYRRAVDGRVKRYTREDGLPSTAVLSLLEDDDGTLWAGTLSGLSHLSFTKSGEFRVLMIYTEADGLLSNPSTELVHTSDGRIWIGQFAGLVSMDTRAPSGSMFRVYTKAQGLKDLSITALTEDHDGNLWVGSEAGGAMKLSGSGFTAYKEDDGLVTARIASIIENRAGDLCVLSGGVPPRSGSGAKYAPLNCFDGTRFKSVPINLPPGLGLTWGWYQSVFQDHLGDWWVDTDRGAYQFGQSVASALPSATVKRIFTTKDGLTGNVIFRQYEDSRGDIWFSTVGDDNATLSRWARAENKVYVYTAQDAGVFRSAPTAFAEDATGNLWIGFYNGGLARYRDGEFAFYSKSDGLPDGLVRGFYLDRKNRLWVATSFGGVARIDEPSDARPHFLVMTSGDGLSSDQVTCITEDNWGRIYLGTGRGIDRLDPESGHIRHFTTADGLPDNFVNVSFRDRHGVLWFGTLRGLARLVPQQDQPAPQPPILITGLRAGNTERPLPEIGAGEVSHVELGPGENSIRAEFVSLSFRSGETLRYQYMLEGAERNWSLPTLQRSVNYASLAPGSYRFLVRAVNSDGLTSTQPASISFRVLPPLWRRWWFISLTVVLITGVILSVAHNRAARVRERRQSEETLRRSREERFAELERVRRRIASDLHDEIGSSLTQISLLSEVVQQRVDGDDPTVTSPLATIATSSRELVDSMSDIVWAINPKKDHLSDLVQRMRSLASEVFTASDVKFHFRAPAANNLPLGANLRREIFLTYKESINNIVKHSYCTEADVELSLDADRLVLKVSDNGKGFGAAQESEGHGLISMRDRAQQMGGTLEMMSAAGQGTTIVLQVPLRDVSPDFGFVGRKRKTKRLRRSNRKGPTKVRSEESEPSA